MGVIASVPLAGALDGAARRGADVFIVSCEDLDRGLASLPGGDESVFVTGVRACSVFPDHDMVLSAEQIEGSGSGAGAAEGRRRLGAAESVQQVEEAPLIVDQ